jgi:outer membrane protein insertion porin family
MIDTMLRATRFACGLGLSLRLGELAQLELNYCIPMRYLPDDRVQHGFQFGIGFSFL